MSPIDRRSVLGSLAALAGGQTALAQNAPAASPPPPFAAAVGGKPTTPLATLKKEGEIACLYHCDFGDPSRFGQMLTNIANHLSAYDNDPFALQLALVAHGPGVKFFLSSLESTQWRDEITVPQIYPRIEALMANGLNVHLCSITFERLKIDRALARPHDKISFTPSGVATLGDLQAKGFGYIKIG